MSTGVKRSITDFFSVSKRQKSTIAKSASTVIKNDSHHQSTPSGLAMFKVNPPTVSQKFDKQGWIKTLTPEQRELLDLEINTMDESWLAVLHQEMTKEYFLDLKKFLKSEWSSGKVIFPPQKDIYSWSRFAPISKVKVLILGQDPYHNYNQAHGLAFSVHDPRTKPPPSLNNIYKCLKKDYPDFEVPKSGDLTKWAKQGVLLLNTCLTVRAHNANSHSNHGWEKFTSAAIRELIDYKNHVAHQGLVVIAWGSPAQRTIQKVGRVDWDQNLFLKSVHPSPLSASRGFFDCQHFVKCNGWLYKRYGDDGLIDWSLVDGNKIEDIEKKRGNKEAEERKTEPEEVVN
ncbi:DEKNAAC102411 [Brettanomyces naardenensis]|uniref:Uracil-DNA glycosylase n=1 Tax=Brettanomyces naardenensis TaxID=13370 RepID=A0A448YLJ6_BRENA|nr:DEKNAAC102411 [Brettanomyces naardenensis]